MKRVDGYQCDNCGEIHETAKGATDCESAHADRLQNAKISGRFQDKSKTWSIDRHIASMFPKTIHVKFSEAYGDHATYERVYVGSRGV